MRFAAACVVEGPGASAIPTLAPVEERLVISYWSLVVSIP